MNDEKDYSVLFVIGASWQLARHVRPGKRDENS
jgi:hypothetical protein